MSASLEERPAPVIEERPDGIRTANLHLYLSTFEYDSRILKETATIRATSLFDEVVFLGIWREGLGESERLSSGERVLRVRTSRFRFRALKALAYFQYWAGAFRATRDLKVKLVHAHALNILPIAVSLKMLRGCRILYATHELETESNGLKGIKKMLHKILERALIGFVDSTQVVGEEIADWYRKHYRLSNVFVVRNIPRARAGNMGEGKGLYFRERFGIPSGSLVFLYQGFLNRGRGIQLLLDVFKKCPRHHVVFMGYGPLDAALKNEEQNYRNIHFHPAVPPQELPAYTAAADVGLSLIENTCLSYYFCLPNKIYEYIHAGVPVIASDFPEMRRLVAERQCGWLVEVNSEPVLKLLESLNAEKVAEVRERILRFRQQIGWHTEEPALRAALEAALKEAA